MSAYRALDDIARELANAYGETNISHPENGPVSIVFDDMAVLFMRVSDPCQFLIAAGLGDLPPNEVERQTLCAKLLKANTCLLATGGFTLSHDPETGVMLQARITYAELEEEGSLTKLLERFLNIANYWKDQCCDENNRSDTLEANVEALLDSGIRA